MHSQRAFVGLAALVAIVLVIVVIGGAYYVTHHTSANSSTEISFTAAPTSGSKPLNVLFKVTGIPNNEYTKYAIDTGVAEPRIGDEIMGPQYISPQLYCLVMRGTSAAGERNYCNGTMFQPTTYVISGQYTATLKDSSGNVLGTIPISVQ